MGDPTLTDAQEAEIREVATGRGRLEVLLLLRRATGWGVMRALTALERIVPLWQGSRTPPWAAVYAFGKVPSELRRPDGSTPELNADWPDRRRAYVVATAPRSVLAALLEIDPDDRNQHHIDADRLVAAAREAAGALEALWSDHFEQSGTIETLRDAGCIFLFTHWEL